jgi:hypothetical protein
MDKDGRDPIQFVIYTLGAPAVLAGWSVQWPKRCDSDESEREILFFKKSFIIGAVLPAGTAGAPSGAGSKPLTYAVLIILK